jgi:hypothetical protein
MEIPKNQDFTHLYSSARDIGEALTVAASARVIRYTRASVSEDYNGGLQRRTNGLHYIGTIVNGDAVILVNDGVASDGQVYDA